jgi:hypothetical protein
MKFLNFFAILQNLEILTFFIYGHDDQITAHPFAPEMTQPETNTGLLVEFDSVGMRSNLVIVAIYEKGQNF